MCKLLLRAKPYLVYTFLTTLLERRHLVQTLIVFGVPLTIALTFLMFGFHFLLVRLIE